MKYDTVMGTIGKTQGVSSDKAPISAASPRYAPSVLAVVEAAMSSTKVFGAPVAAARGRSTAVASAPVPGTMRIKLTRSVAGGRQKRSVHV